MKGTARLRAAFKRWTQRLRERIAVLGRDHLLTWQLWDGLQKSPDARWQTLIADRYDRHGFSPWAYLTVVMLVLSIGTLVLFSGVIWGLFSAYRTARVITHERNRDTLDLLSITPVGASGVRWLIFAVTLHFDIDLRHFDGLRRLVLSVVAFPFVMFILILSVLWMFSAADYGTSVLYPVLLWLTLIPLVYLDPVYGLITGGLLGILAPTYLRTDAHILAMGGVILLQVGVYALTFGLGFGLPLLLLDRLHLFGLTLLLPLLALALYIALHEFLTLWLWQVIARRVGDRLAPSLLFTLP
ncbi:MAG: hypothetical protein K8L99_23690 [Anaerolineae bacterium]|nr:hypothetical protein [Anaerolineae bacterium]